MGPVVVQVYHHTTVAPSPPLQEEADIKLVCFQRLNALKISDNTKNISDSNHTLDDWRPKATAS